MFGSCYICVFVQGVVDNDFVVLAEDTSIGDLAFVISTGTQLYAYVSLYCNFICIHPAPFMSVAAL